GNDTMLGGAGNDKIYGEAGDDLLDGGAGDDYLDGGAGNETYRFVGGGLGSDVVVEPDNVGTDTLDFTTFVGPVTVDLGRTTTQVVTPNNLTLRLTSATGIENAIGSPLDDLIIGNTRANVLWGLAGNDTLKGLDNNDTLYGGDGNDLLDGGVGDDVLY